MKSGKNKDANIFRFSLFIFRFSFFLKEKVFIFAPAFGKRRTTGAGAKQAGIAQLVEHDLAKVGVASSSLVSRSIKTFIE